MPLRVRLIALVITALSASLALGGVVSLVNAARSVQTEMLAALKVGRQTIDNVVRQIDDSPNPQREIDDLIDSFRGSRHLRVAVTATGAAQAEIHPVGDRSPFGRVPAWFVRAIGIVPEIERIPFTIHGRPAGTFVVQTDPSNETVEVWNELSGSLLVWALFAGGTIPLIYLLIGRALRPLGRLTGAMERVGGGDYTIRVDDRLTPEFARLRDSFNRMAERLAVADIDNRRLNEQLARLQEEERNELARDLHDEIGPVLFAINVDLLNMKRLLKDAQDGELAAQVRSVEDSVRHLQHQIRGMLGRLRPILPAELSLPQAIEGLLEFWRRQCPHIALEADVSTRSHELGDPLYTTVYRILQESLSNAIRHGQPAAVTVAIACDDLAEELVLEVADDGVGARGEPELGYGLTGMKERARALGGSLTFANRPGGGFVVRAELPLQRANVQPVGGAG